MIGRFYERMIQDIQTVDILGSWLKEELILKKELSRARKCPLPYLEAYFHGHPWSQAFKGRKVLVIHPFEKSIQRQYARREELFENANVLPEFKLLTFKAVQSLGTAHDRSKFKDWFQALSWMEERISRFDFDIALIACGAYGLPLAAHAKRLGKKAIHLGGATQILFGIKGTRWERISSFAVLFKDSCIRP